MTSDAVRDARLVLRAQSGDTEALNELFGGVGPALGRHLRHIVRHDGLAEDALQEAFLLAYRKIRWLRDPLLFRPWIYRIATREAIRRAHRERKRPETSLDGPGWEGLPETTGARPVDQILRDQAAATISQVSPASRAVLSLHYLEGYTLQESAEILGLSTGTVKSRLAAGLVQLRRRLGFDTSERGHE